MSSQSHIGKGSKSSVPILLPANIGEVLGGYRLDVVIGNGGMGSVYRATHARLGRKAAVKVLASRLAADHEYVSRFFQEAKVVNDIDHPNIVDVIDFVEIDEPRRVAYIMELLTGPTLTSAMKSQRFTLQQSINACLQLTGALAAVHARDVIHRDLKPDNIIIVAPLDSDMSSAPSLKILDFGVAKTAATDGGHRTSEGMTFGTPAYMAPEQVISAPASSATDVYALGEIFYEMVAGRRAFIGNSAGNLKAKVMGTMPDLTISDDVPGAQRITSFVEACLDTKPESRPTIRQFQIELRSLLLGARSPSSIGDEMPSAAFERVGEWNDEPTLVAGSGRSVSTPRESSAPDTEPRALAQTLELVSPISRNGSPALAVAIIASVALLATVGAWAFMSHSERTVIVEATIVPTDDSPPSEAAKDSADSEQIAPARVPDGARAGSDLPAGIVAIDTTPPGAEIVDLAMKKTLGTSPLTVDGAASRMVEVRAKGYVSQTIALDPKTPHVNLVLVHSGPAKGTSPAKPQIKSQPKPQTKPQTKPRTGAAAPLNKDDVPSW